MKFILSLIVTFLLASLMFKASTLHAFALPASNSTARQAVAPTDKGWPRTLTDGSTSFSIYQPQIESWKENRLESRAAVAVTTGQRKQPVYGVVWFAARTEI